MIVARKLPLCVAGALFAPLGVIAAKGEVPLLMALALAALAVIWGRARAPHAQRRWVGVAVIGALGWALLSVSWTLDPIAGLATWGRIAAIALATYVLAASARDLSPTELRTLSLVIVAGFALALLLLLAEQLTGLAGRDWYYTRIGRPEALDPTLLNRPGAILLLAAWPAALALHRLGRSRLALLPPLFALATVLAGVSSSNKLAAVLALVAAAAVWRFRRIALRALPLTIVACLLAAPLLPTTILSPALMEDRFDDYDSGLHRLYIWEFSAWRIADRPLTGWGLNAAPLIPGGEAKLPQGGNRMNVHPHNAFLQVWLELGGIGAAALAVLLLAVAGALARWREAFTAACGAGLLVSALVIANLSFGVWQTWWMAVLALAGLLAVALRPDTADGQSPGPAA